MTTQERIGEYLTRPKLIAELALTCFFLTVFAVAMVEASTYGRNARIFPVAAAVSGISLCLFHILLLSWSQFRIRSQRPRQGTRQDGASEGNILSPLVWIASYYFGIAVFGFTVGSSLYVLIAMTVSARLRWYWAIASTVGVFVLVRLLAQLLNLRVPPSLLG